MTGSTPTSSSDRETKMKTLNPAGFPLGVAVAAILIAAAVPAQAQDAAAVQAATEGYARLNAGDLDAAVAAARRAVAAAPEHLDYRLLLADALLRAGRDEEAFVVLQPVREVADYRVQTRLAQAAAASGHKAEAAKAFGAAAPLATEPESRAYLTRAQIMTLVELDRRDEARAAFDAGWASGVLRGPAPLDTAMLAIAVGDDVKAQEAFKDAWRAAPLSGRVALDAGYSARRLGRDADAVRYFELGLTTIPEADATVERQRRHEIAREIETLKRRWGFTASISRGVATTTATATPGSENLTQAGLEAYYRLGGYRDGRPLDLFVRGFGTLDADQGGATGGDTIQGWAGLRWKPFSRTNLILEGSRMFKVGDLARDDTMLRAAWSAESSGDLRYDRASWTSWRLYGDVARILDDEQTLAVAEARAGRTWQVGDRTQITPFVRIRLNHDSLLPDPTAIGAGPGVAWRYWYRETGQAAPASYLDFNLGYDFSLSGDGRSEGVSAGFILNY